MDCLRSISIAWKSFRPQQVHPAQAQFSLDKGQVVTDEMEIKHRNYSLSKNEEGAHVGRGLA